MLCVGATGKIAMEQWFCKAPQEKTNTSWSLAASFALFKKTSPTWENHGKINKHQTASRQVWVDYSEIIMNYNFHTTPSLNRTTFTTIPHPTFPTSWYCGRGTSRMISSCKSWGTSTKLSWIKVMGTSSTFSTSAHGEDGDGMRWLWLVKKRNKCCLIGSETHVKLWCYVSFSKSYLHTYNDTHTHGAQECPNPSRIAIFGHRDQIHGLDG
jgi:hypothetical protein